MRSILAFGVYLMLLAYSGAANAEIKKFGAFVINTDAPDFIILSGSIDNAAALNFRRALDEAPSAKVLVLNSPGGLVHMGLLIADDVYKRGMSTFIPEESICYSACSFIFLAGASRLVEGELGVHQISSDSGDLSSAQVAISDIIDVLDKFDTPAGVLTAMFRTPHSDIHVFSESEIVEFGINRDSGSADVSASGEKPETGDRIALYLGLDFYGSDAGSFNVSDAGECAARCVEYLNTCRAFTFNTSPKAKSGPNCFIKSMQGQPDGNFYALSGLVIASEKAPSFTIGVIDPERGLLEDADLPGGDLSQRPAAGISNATQCRLRCASDASCRAFTFIEANAQCWLKGRVPQARYAKGMVSGVKRIESFSAVETIPLQ